jgi:hypothetical protein
LRSAVWLFNRSTRENNISFLNGFAYLFGMSGKDNTEHLQILVREFCSRLGFPESKLGNGQDLNEKLTGAVFVLWAVLVRVCGITCLDSYVADNPTMTPKQLKTFVRQCARSSAQFTPEFTVIVEKMMSWTPPPKAKKRRRK